MLGKRGWVGGLGEELEKCVEADETYDLSFRISHSAAAGGSRWCLCCATRKWGLRKEFDAETLCRITTLLARRRSRGPEISRLPKGGVKRVSASVGRNPADVVRARYLAARKPLRWPRDDKEVIDSRVLGQHPMALGERARVPLPARQSQHHQSIPSQKKRCTVLTTPAPLMFRISSTKRLITTTSLRPSPSLSQHHLLNPPSLVRVI